MKQVTTIAKQYIINTLNHFGYEFVRIKDALNTEPIPVFPLIVRDYIRRKKAPGFFFVQVGANDGVMADPIRPLVYEFGNWRGVLLEPNPAVYEILKSNYHDQPGLSFECLAISDTEGVATLHVSGDSKETIGQGSLDANFAAIAAGISKSAIRTVNIKTATLNTLFAKHNIQEMDLLQIDAEGHDYKILVQLLTDTKVRPSIIQFEHSLMDKTQYGHCSRLLSNAGYRILPVGIDTVALRDAEKQ
jgi:FkbM family methyltransferase